MSLLATLAALPLAAALALGGPGTAVNASTGAPLVASLSAPGGRDGGRAPVLQAPLATISAVLSNIKQMVGGAATRILTSKPACIAVRDFHNTLPLPTV